MYREMGIADQLGTVLVRVANHGRQPVSIVDVGLFGPELKRFGLMRRRRPYIQMSLDYGDSRFRSHLAANFSLGQRSVECLIDRTVRSCLLLDQSRSSCSTSPKLRLRGLSRTSPRQMSRTDLSSDPMPWIREDERRLLKKSFGYASPPR
jgi:hypothetical protein